MNLASTVRMMAEKKDAPPFDVSKADYAGAAKELTKYAMTKGGMDKNDFLAFANRMSAIAGKKAPRVNSKFARDLLDLDTSPREKIVSVMRNNGIKVSVQGGGFKIEDFDIEQLEAMELEEAKVQGREVFDKTFANRTQADNFAKKNGGRVKQVGRVFYVFKEAKEDDEPASPDEGSMAMQQLEFIEYAADKLSDHIKDGGDFPEWMQNKLATVNDQMQSLYSQIDQDGSDQMDEAYKTPAEAKAYEDGKKAVARKVSYDDNPNKKGTKEYTAWSKGHNDARARMIGKRFSKEEVELDEAKRDPSKSGGTGYDLYHKDFSTAMAHAYKYAKDKLGIEIDPKEIDDKVASGPRKPSSGKTNTYRLKGKDGKKGVQIQVANLDNKKYELNMYKESVEMTEEVNLDELFESAFEEELTEAMYQVDIKGAGRETVMAKNEKDAIAKASKKMKVHSFKSSDVTVKLAEEVEEKLSLEDTLKAIWEGKKLDPVNKKALKKDFDDRKDKDLDNDGDTDDSDEYLHKKRQAVSKAVEKDSDEAEAQQEKEISDKEDEPKGKVGKSNKQTKVDVNPSIEEEKGEEMTSAEMEKRDEIMKSLENKKDEFVKKYGDRAKEVMARTAIKMAKKHA